MWSIFQIREDTLKTRFYKTNGSFTFHINVILHVEQSHEVPLLFNDICFQFSSAYAALVIILVAFFSFNLLTHALQKERISTAIEDESRVVYSCAPKTVHYSASVVTVPTLTSF